MRSGERSGASASEPLVVSGDSLRLPGFDRMTDVTGETGVLGVTPGVVFVLAAGGLRHLDRTGSFLGYPPGVIFWRDVLELVHEDDLPRAEAIISRVMEEPGTSLSAGLRFRDASGNWRLMDTSAQNILEAPGDTGLVVVNVREAPPLLDGTAMDRRR
jgi:hypothetical protein